MSSDAATAVPDSPGQQVAPRAGKRFARTRQSVAATTLSAQGEPMIWLTGGALAVALIMIVGLLVLVIYQGLRTFWPAPIERVVTDDGRVYLGETAGEQRYVPSDVTLASLPPEVAETVRRQAAAGGGSLVQENLRIENFELSNEHFVWIDKFRIQQATFPEWAVAVERLTNGRFYGTPVGFLIDGQEVASTPAEAWARFREYHAAARQEADQEPDREGKLRYQLRMQTADGQESLLPLGNIVRAYPANQLGLFGRLGVYLSRWREFLCDGPREANSEGGVFPAIFGTVAMTLMMSVAVVPFGVLAALYLREYAKAGPIVSAVRIAINNLAGVPSIVFGVFGLGFFCYLVGGQIDRVLFAAQGASVFGTAGILWASLTLALLTLAGGDHHHRRGAGRGARLDARRLVRLRSQQMANDLSHRPAAGNARHHDRNDSGDGPRGRRSGAADASGGDENGPRIADRSTFPYVHAQRSVHAFGLSHLRSGISQPEQRGGGIHGVYHDAAAGRDRGGAEYHGDLAAWPAAPPICRQPFLVPAFVLHFALPTGKVKA